MEQRSSRAACVGHGRRLQTVPSVQPAGGGGCHVSCARAGSTLRKNSAGVGSKLGVSMCSMCVHMDGFAVWLWGIAGCVDCAIAIQLGCRKRYGNFGKSMSRPWSRPTARSATRCSLIKGGSPRVGCGTRGPGFFHLLGRIYSRARGVRSCHTCASSHRLWRLACARLLFRVIIIGDPRRCLSPPCRMCMPCAPTCIVTVSLSASPRPGYK